MTDRELLDLAAKAAGVEIEWYGEYAHEAHSSIMNARWDPLEFDDQAFQLSVKLDLELYRGDNDGPAVFVGYWGKPERRDVSRLYCIQHVGDDPYAATRRAIVRAAAEIGRNMP